MFIALIGTRFSGKSTVKDFLVNQRGFTPVQVLSRNNGEYPDQLDGRQCVRRGDGMTKKHQNKHEKPELTPLSDSQQDRPTSFLMLGSPISPSFPQDVSQEVSQSYLEELCFQSYGQLLEHVTRNWRSNFVTLDLNTQHLLKTFLTRPFVMVVCVDAPLLHRFRRSSNLGYGADLEEFVKEHDTFYYGSAFLHTSSRPFGNESPATCSLRSMSHLAKLHILNSFETRESLYEHLDNMDITNSERLRPSWDTYFMQLATLASHRSNCMKRRVGAIVVRNNRILATGYNGTPRGLTNCAEGGCTRCNTAAETSDECVCLHAEENALLEAGRDRIGDGSVIYCNTCPCLKCTIKIIQTGVREVVYNLSYKVDDASAALFQEAGVTLRRHAPPQGVV